MQNSTAGGFGRLLFTLDPPAHVQADAAGGIITIAFDRKVDVPPASLTQGLESYVASVRLDADGKVFRLAASQSLHVHESVSGNKIAVDLVPESFAGAPPDLPPPPAKAIAAVDVASLPPLIVRAGAYAQYARLVFDWPHAVPYAVFRGSGRTTIRFEAAARPDFSALEHVSPPWVKEAGWHIDGRGTVIDFDTDAASTYRASRVGSRIVLDILAPKSDLSAYNPPDEKRPGAAAAPTQSSAQAKAVSDVAATLNASTVAAPPPASPLPPAPKGAQTQPAPPPPTAVSQPSPPAEPAQAGNALHAQRTKDGAVIVIPGAAERAVAAFVRGRTATVVLDGRMPLDVTQLKSALGDLPSSVDASSDQSLSIVRIVLRKPAQMTVEASGADLRVVLAPHLTATAVSLEFARSPDSHGAPALSVNLPGALHVLPFTDSEVGDTLLLVPGNTGHALPVAHEFAEFAALPSAAGLVIKAYRDDLDLRVAKGQIVLGRPAGLSLSELPRVAESPSALVGASHGRSFLDLDGWARESRGHPYAAQRRLRMIAAAARTEDANPARLALARNYLATGFAAEALGEIALIRKSDPAMVNDPALLTMSAAADVMMGRYRDANNALSLTVLTDDRNAALWRGLADAGMMNWEAARKSLAWAEPVLGSYAAPWQAKARIAMAEASLATGATSDADAALAHLPPNLPAALAREAELARGEMAAAEGRSSAAADIFQALEGSGDERVAARASFAEVESGLAHGFMSRDVAIAKLEALRFRWRGDALELATLRKLGELYFAQSRWRDGLNVLRVAVQNFPHEDRAREAQDDMRKAFDALFLSGKAQSLPPIAALGLFYDFVDLTPIGPDGDEMIRRMTDRLVAMDLLEPAASLLNYQVNKRLDGVARAQVATRLAMIDLMDHRPKPALEALRVSDVSGLPDSVGHARKILQARALAALKQWDRAQDVIALDDAPDSRRLRADIYWESGNWEAAGQKAEEMLAPRAGDAQPLSAEEREEVMRAAISYSLASDEKGVDRLRDRFAPKMKPGPDASAFAVVTQPIEDQGAAFRDRASQIASIDTLEAFMRDFRKHFDAQLAMN
ncbi:MAG TPA: hypothetical protein VGF97_00365 [Rhizomicrobium sp.]